MKRRKMEPAVQTLSFETPTATSSGEQFFIDIAQCASLLNRRFYRQGYNWAVAGIKVMTSTPGVVTIQKLPDTWTMSNSWHKGYAAWTRMNNEALEESESIRPRFLDFKIFANARHHEKGFGANLLPYTYSTDKAGTQTTSTAVPGEWIASKIVQPVTGPAVADPGEVYERQVMAVGANYPGANPDGFNAVSLIEGYANSRALPDIQSPNVPDDVNDTDGATPENWLGSIFNEGTQQSSEVLEDLRTENDIPPYPFENDGAGTADTMYPGGENQLNGLALHDLSFVTGTTVGGHTRIKGGQFPCGLIALNWKPDEVTSNVLVEVSLVPGQYRGYLAAPMQDM